MPGKIGLIASVTVALSLWSGPVPANGRFPRAERVKELAPDTILLTGTFGLLLTSNRGQDWHFVCESLLFGRSARGSWIDPFLELLGGGVIVTGSPHALRVSRTGACSFQTDLTLPVDPTFFSEDVVLNDSGVIVDLTRVSAKGDQSLVALITLNDAEGRAFEHRLFETNDGASTWHALGSPIPVATAHPLLTVDVAPSDPNRIYVSGSTAGALVLLRSVDAGQSWTSHALSVEAATDANGAYIAAVAPANPDHLYVRVPRWAEDELEELSWDDSLLFSADAGESFAEILRKPANLLGFSLAPDGSTVLAGFGDPEVAPVFTDSSAHGLYRASVADHVFEQALASVSVSCISWTLTGLYVCAKERDPLGLSSEVDFQLGLAMVPEPTNKEDFSTLLKLKDVRGPMPWSDGRASECDSDWLEGDPEAPQTSSTCQMLNACDAAANPPAGGATLCMPGSNADGGSHAGGASGQAGSPAGAAAGLGSGPGSGASSCGCRVQRRTGVVDAWLPILAALLAHRRLWARVKRR